MHLNVSRRGAALLTALAILVVVGGIATLMFTRTLAEVRHSGDDSGIIQSLALARGAANMGGAVLQGPAYALLNTIVRADSSTTNRWSFGTGAGTEPDPLSVVQALSTNTGSVANKLQTQLNTVLCSATPPTLGTGESVTLRIHVTSGNACGQALPAGVVVPTGRFVEGLPRDGSGSANRQIYALPFVMVAEGQVGEYSRSIVTSGEYHFTVGRGSFAQYALFTNVHTASAGTDIWFTENTLFDGPVHTNQHFRFYRNPWFGGSVTSAGCSNPGPTSCSSGSGNHGAYFYGVNGRVSSGSMTPNATAPSYTNAYGTHAPQFAAGVGWESPFVRLPENNQDQRNAAQTGGILFTRNLDYLTLAATDAGMNPMPTDGSGTSAFQLIEGCYIAVLNAGPGWGNRDWLQCEEYRVNALKIMERRFVVYRGVTKAAVVHSATPWVLAGTFNGAVFADGQIRSLSGPGRTGNQDDPDNAHPALAAFAQVTVASNSLIRITGDLKYQNPPCSGTPTRESNGSVTPATCDDLDAENILGVYTQSGNVLIGHGHTSSGSSADAHRGNSHTRYNSPRDITIHGVLMSSSGIVGVENYDSGGARGDVHLLGGIIEYYYGAFGTFNSSSGAMSSGYSRAFTFDRRTGNGMAPPYFPTVGNDNVIDVATFSFGQREQVE